MGRWIGSRPVADFGRHDLRAAKRKFGVSAVLVRLTTHQRHLHHRIRRCKADVRVCSYSGERLFCRVLMQSPERFTSLRARRTICMLSLTLMLPDMSLACPGILARTHLHDPSMPGRRTVGHCFSPVKSFNSCARVGTGSPVFSARVIRLVSIPPMTTSTHTPLASSGDRTNASSSGGSAAWQKIGICRPKQVAAINPTKNLRGGMIGLYRAVV